MKRALGIVQSPVVRWAFLLAALALAAWAVARDWDVIATSVASMPWWLATLGLALSVAYVAASFASWRTVMSAMGAHLSWRDGAHVFLVSQLGKYIPGGVWNVVAGAELARDKGVSRSRAAVALAVTMLTSILVGTALAAVGLAFAPHGWPAWTRLGGLAAPVALALLTPSLLTRLVHLALKAMRRDTGVPAFTWGGIGRVAGWALIAWLLAGFQLFALGVGLGLEATPGTALLAVTGFAGAWLVGFAALFMPAGIGARELVLVPVLSSHIDGGELVALIVLSRVFFTAADVAGAAVPALWRRRVSDPGAGT